MLAGAAAGASALGASVTGDTAIVDTSSGNSNFAFVS
jgi:hypothetical protein